MLTIGNSVFFNCNITELNLTSVTSIGDENFKRCGSLVKITFGKPITSFRTKNFNVFNNGIDVDTTKIDLVFASGQKAFGGSNDTAWTLTEYAIVTGENVEFAGYTFKSISVV